MQTTLSCRDLSKRYRGQDRYALGDETSGVSFDVGEGELFALLGPSGCGKTTTLRIVGGFIEPSAGEVEIRGQDVTALPPHRRPTNTVFQSYALFPHRNVADNVAFGLRMGRVPRPSWRQFKTQFRKRAIRGRLPPSRRLALAVESSAGI